MPLFERQVRAAAKEHGIPVFVASAESAEQVPTALQQLSDQKVDAVIVPADGLFNAGQRGIVDLGLKLRLPLVVDGREGVVSGGLASYGISTRENYRRAADYVGKIFKGATADTLSIELSSFVMPLSSFISGCHPGGTTGKLSLKRKRRNVALGVI